MGPSTSGYFFASGLAQGASGGHERMQLVEGEVLIIKTVLQIKYYFHVVAVAACATGTHTQRSVDTRVRGWA
jgi:hypothetical protein